MAERTINGKSPEDIIKELTIPFKPDDFKVNRYGFHYLPVDKYRERLNEVVGVLNYDFVTSEPKVTTVGTRPHIPLSGSITIRDDAGNIVSVKAACGGTQVIMTNIDNEAVLFKNDCDSAAEDVFKRCCKSIGMAEAQIKQLRGTKGSDGNNNSYSEPTEPITLYRVKLREAFSSIGKFGYGAMVDIDGETEPRKMMIWKSGQQEIEKYMPIAKFIQNYKAGMTFSTYGYKTVFIKKDNTEQLQLVLEKPYRNDEGS